jgi:PucR family transcriptional regulator, purine catabolism regulatory protein
MYKNTTTIDDVYRLALPDQTQLLVGAEYLNRPVSWACSLRPSPPAFPKLDGNELALIDMEDLRRLDPKMRLDRVLRSLQTARVSAVAVLGDADDGSVKLAARDCQLVLFHLPASSSLTQVERSVIRLIVDRAGYIAQRSAELQRELSQAALNGGGLQKVALRLQSFVQQPIVLLGNTGQLNAVAGLDTLVEDQRQAILDGLPNLTMLRTWTATQPMENLPTSVGTLPLVSASHSAPYEAVVVAAICANDSVHGYCLLLRSKAQAEQEISAVEEVAALQGASAAALEWAKQNAVGIAEERMRATFLDELLAAEIADEQAWIRRGTSLNYDLSRPHVAMLVEASGVPGWPAPFMRFVQQRQVMAPHTRRDEGLLIFWPVENPKSGRELKAIANEFVANLSQQQPKARLVIGIGRPGLGPANWLQSQQQARESWRLGKEWETAPVTYFGDLGLYQLLTGLSTNPEAARFFRKTLGKLISHDDNKNAELVQTLDAYFACHGNLSQTATRLHIHRNTLTYRLEQIANITQLDLEDPDARFSLQLALKLRPVLR